MLRLARTEDIPRLIDIRAAVRENRLSDPASIAAADYHRYIDAGCCWAWEQNGAIDGFSALDPEAASVWALFVAPPAEGRGAGRALMQALIAHARRLGLSRLTLATAPGSRAESFYRRAGWSPLAADASGDLLMQLDLGAK